MSLKPVFASEVTLLSTGLDSLAGTASATSTEQDNNTNRYLDGWINIEAASASADTGYCSVYIMEGSATGKLSTSAQLSNMRKVDDIQMSGTTTVRKSVFIKNMPEFYAIHFIKNATPALAASGNTVKFVGINYENV